MIEVKVPDLAESITEGTISKWLKEEGEAVQEGEILLELETDKVNLEINAEQDGVLIERLKQEGESVSSGEVVALLRTERPGEERGGERETEVKEKRGRGEETVVQEERVEEQERRTGAEPVEKKEGIPSRQRPVATPAARRKARKQGWPLEQLESKDPWGRIQANDLSLPSQREEAYLAGQKRRFTLSSLSGEPLVTEETARPVERIPMSRRRQTIARRLVEAQQTAAMLTTFNEVDMSAIIQLRQRHQEAFLEEHQVKLGYMSFFTKAVVGALKQFPLLNAEIEGDEIIVKKYYDIGIAVSTEEGLVVPVLRQADKKSFPEIEREIAALAEKARANKLSLADLRGGTFTITNGGIFGSLLSTPILNPPQVGILGMHTIQTRPVSIDGERMENRPMMFIALSYDHRIVDGKEAVSFLVKVKSLLEDPERLLLEG